MIFKDGNNILPWGLDKYCVPYIPEVLARCNIQMFIMWRYNYHDFNPCRAESILGNIKYFHIP